MQQYKKDFIDFMLEAGVLTFGDFTTKSGRKTPYFINTGLYRTGKQLQKLGYFYAQAIENEFKTDIDVLFGPAYKGIPLVAATAIALNQNGENIAFCFNRKEAKDHGEKGVLVGHTPQNNDRILIVEDVTTAGTSIRETVPLLEKAAAVSIAGLIVSVDRCERGQATSSALQELATEFSMQTCSIVTVYDILEYVDIQPQDRERIENYLKKYGSQ